MSNPPDSADSADAGPSAGAGRLQAVLFDMDGTLTDSERLWSTALDEVAAELDGAVSTAARAAMVGLPMIPTIELLHRDLGVVRDWTLTRDELWRAVAVHYRHHIVWRPGAARLLAAVRAAGLRTALVTATDRLLVEIALDTLGRHNFDVVVTGDDVTAGKPDPQPYLHALDRLGVAADAALAVEDSAHGTESAAAAGLTVLVVPCEAPVEGGARRVLIASLVDVTVQRLQLMHAAHTSG